MKDVDAGIFNDEFFVSDGLTSLDGGGSCDFPWDELYQCFGESEEPERNYDQFIAAMNVLFDWMLQGGLKKGGDAFSGRRLIALAWVINPNRFNGRSVASIARDIGISAPLLQKLTGEVSRTFGVRNRGQQHSNGNWKKAA
jgi:hypothetical protein